jgi:iron complex transport system permease protein
MALKGRMSNDAIDRILFATRLPRIILCAAVGSALATAGLSAQTLFRNPLASPYIVGVSGGSAVGAVVAMLLIGEVTGITFTAVPLFSVVGGLTVTAIVFFLGRRGRHVGPSLLLAGIAIGALCSSVTAAALYLAGERLQVLVFWLMGGLWRANWREVLLMVPVSSAGLVALIILAPSMNVALVGERSAQDLGVNIARLQKYLLVLIGVETAVAVSLTGIIGFVGLIVPHLLRLIIGADHRRLVPATAISGALLLIIADTLARTLAAPVEVPVGILTAVVGAPVFLWLLQRRSTIGAIE